jgi:hypothetical protein
MPISKTHFSRLCRFLLPTCVDPFGYILLKGSFCQQLRPSVKCSPTFCVFHQPAYVKNTFMSWGLILADLDINCDDGAAWNMDVVQSFATFILHELHPDQAKHAVTLWDSDINTERNNRIALAAGVEYLIVLARLNYSQIRHCTAQRVMVVANYWGSRS